MTREPPMIPASGRADVGHADSLVAAAPELLAVLKQLFEESCLISGPTLETCARAEAVIAKAEGR